MDEEKTPAEQLYSEAIVQGAIGAIEGLNNPGAAIPYERREVEMLRKALDLGLPFEKQISSHVMIGINLFDIGRKTGEIDAERIRETGLESISLALNRACRINQGLPNAI